MISRKEYNEAVETWSGNLFRFIYKFIRQEDWCNDIIQDTYLKLWQNREDVNPEKVKSWLFTVSYNLMINQIKRQSKFTVIEDHHERTASSSNQKDFEIKDLLNKALDELPEIQKSIILLRDLEGYNYDEIGQILQLNESQVKVYLFRARQKLKNTIKELNITL